MGNNPYVKFDIRGEHGWPTDDYGGDCFISQAPWLNLCNFNLALDIMKVFSDPILDPVDFNKSRFFSFKQAAAFGMHETGYAYIPEYCEMNECPVHFQLHGCGMNSDQIGFAYIMHSQFNEIAEANKIVVVYPQVKDVQLTPKQKSGACWDFVGYSD